MRYADLVGPPARAAWFVVTVLLASAGQGCKGREEARPQAAPQATTGTVEVVAELPEAVKPPPGPGGSVEGVHPMAPVSDLTFVFGEHGGAAYVVGDGDGVRVVHNGKGGKRYQAVGDLVLSPDGRRCAYGALAGGKWRMVIDGAEGRAFDTVREPVFSPAGDHLAYQAMSGERWHLVVDATVNAGTTGRYLGHRFTADGKRLVFVGDVGEDDAGTLAISDLALKRPKVVATGVLAFHVNEAKTSVAAVVLSGGKQRVDVLDLAGGAPARTGPEFEAISDVTFGRDGVRVSYMGERDAARLVVEGGREAVVTYGGVMGAPVPRPGSPAVGAILEANGSMFLREFFVPEGPREALFEEAESLVYSGDGRSRAYVARRGERWFLVVNGKEGPAYDRAVTPQFTPDGERVVYRARQDGRRFVVVADLDARTLKQGAPAEQVFPVSFTADGRFGYGVKEGARLEWRVEAP